MMLLFIFPAAIYTYITYFNINTQVPARFLIHILNQDLKIPRDVASPALAHKRKAARDPTTGCCCSFLPFPVFASFERNCSIKIAKAFGVHLVSQANPCTPDKKTKKGRLLESRATAPRISRAFTVSPEVSPERHLANAGFPRN